MVNTKKYPNIFWVAGIGLILLVGKCAYVPDFTWREEVLLSDGRITVVERKSINESGGGEWASNRGGYKIKEYRIKFVDPVSPKKMIEWQSTKLSEMRYPETPLAFYIERGVPTIYTLVSISRGCEVYSKYTYSGAAWAEETLPDQFEVVRTNLMFGSEKDLPELVTVREKEFRNSGSGYRRALKQIGPARKACGD